jgi:hypothetical protein
MAKQEAFPCEVLMALLLEARGLLLQKIIPFSAQKIQKYNKKNI